MTAPQPAAKTAPRMGSRRTKARNLRRKRSAASALNPPLTEVSDTPKQKQHVASTQKNIRLPTIPLVAAPPRPTSKIIMTTVELDDSAQMSKKRKTPIPKKAARDSLKNSTNAIDIKTPTDANGNVGPLKEKMAIGLKETFDQNKDPGVSLVSAVDVSPPPNYEELAKLDGHPRVGDVVAYKLLEIGSSYMPMISDFKEATVISFSEADLEAQVLLNPRFRKVIEMDLEGRPILGKFDIYDEDTIERTQQGIAIVSWKDLVDCRVVSRK
ncbi:MAG: hypothetical protein J3Q66DRAFT_325224 [Benniella sp.]|nr:MAG: hypothetical protein J3Q66DRAFT_325224 [Benniella sp.]